MCALQGRMVCPVLRDSLEQRRVVADLCVHIRVFYSQFVSPRYLYVRGAPLQLL